MSKPKPDVEVTTKTSPLVVSIRGAALLLDVSKQTIWRMIAAREIEITKVGAVKKIRVKEIERYLEENSTPVRKAS